VPFLFGSCAKESTSIETTSMDQRIVVSSHLLGQWVAPLAAACEIDMLRLQQPEADVEHSLPVRDALRAAQSARLILVHGAGWESWLKQVALPASRMVVTATPGPEGWIHRAARTHSHGLAGSHTHAARHPRTWMDPHAAKLQLDAVVAAIEANFELDAAQLEALEQAHLGLLEEVAHYANSLQGFGEAMQGKAVIASSEEFAYLARPLQRPIPVIDFDAFGGWSSSLRNQLRAAMPAAHGGCVLFSELPPPEIAQQMQEELGLQALVVPVQATGAPNASWLAEVAAGISSGNF